MNGIMSWYELCTLSIHLLPSFTVSRISLDSLERRCSLLSSCTAVDPSSSCIMSYQHVLVKSFFHMICMGTKHQHPMLIYNEVLH